jgi:hypothetical protein
VTPGRDHPHRDGQKDRDHNGHDGDIDRGPKAVGHHVDHVGVRDQRGAKITLKHLAEPRDELDVQRIVQAQPVPDTVKLRGRRGVAGQDRRRIARRQPEQQEDEDRDDQ